MHMAWPGVGAGLAVVPIFDIMAMSPAIVPILVPLDGVHRLVATVAGVLALRLLVGPTSSLLAPTPVSSSSTALCLEEMA